MHQGYVRRIEGITVIKLSVLIEYLLCSELQLLEEVFMYLITLALGREKKQKKVRAIWCHIIALPNQGTEGLYASEGSMTHKHWLWNRIGVRIFFQLPVNQLTVWNGLSFSRLGDICVSVLKFWSFVNARWLFWNDVLLMCSWIQSQKPETMYWGLK